VEADQSQSKTLLLLHLVRIQAANCVSKLRIAGDTLNRAFRNHLPAMSVISNLGSLKQLSQLMHPGKVNLRLGPSVACKHTYTISTLQRFLRLGPAEAQS